LFQKNKIECTKTTKQLQRSKENEIVKSHKKHLAEKREEDVNQHTHVSKPEKLCKHIVKICNIACSTHAMRV
jgi:hypothetical protein